MVGRAEGDAEAQLQCHGIDLLAGMGKAAYFHQGKVLDAEMGGGGRGKGAERFLKERMP